jgi:gamma-glutamylcysteine synthetase
VGEHNEQQNEQQNNNLEQLSLPELEKKLEELKDVLTKLDPKANPDEYKKVEENIKIVE